MTRVQAGTWVELERVLLPPEERAPGLPEDTRACPYVLRVSGFLEADADLGGPAAVRSLIGHRHEGTLAQVNPSYSHSFGSTVAELLQIRPEGRA